MDHLNAKMIEMIEERDVPGQLLLDLGMTPTVKGLTAVLNATEKALNKPAIEEPKKSAKSYSRPTVYDVDNRGEIQPCDRELGGYVAIEDYDALLGAFEESQDECTRLAALLFDIRELTDLMVEEQ